MQRIPLAPVQQGMSAWPSLTPGRASKDVNDIAVYTLYDHPTDLPEHVVVRAFGTLPDGSPTPGPAWLFDTVAAAESFLVGRGLACLGRDELDHETVLSSWA